MKTALPDQSAANVRSYRTFSLRFMVSAVLLLSVLLAITKQTGLLTQQLVWWGLIPERTLITPYHEFAGEKYYLFELTEDIHLPDDIAITFKDPEDLDFYVLRIDRSSRQVLRATPFDMWNSPILVDISGDAVAELVLGEDVTKLENFNYCILYPFLTYRDAYGNVGCGELFEIESIHDKVQVYSLKSQIRKLFEQDIFPSRGLRSYYCGGRPGGSSRSVEHSRTESWWADLYGNKVPVLGWVREQTITTSESGSRKHEETKHLTSYWSFEPTSGEWLETECNIPIAGNSLDGLLTGLDYLQETGNTKPDRER